MLQPQLRKNPEAVFHVVRSLTKIRWAGKGTTGHDNPAINHTEQIKNPQSQCTELPVLTMYTKDNCSLCDAAKAELQKFSGLLHLEEIDITGPENKEWFDKYKYDIPVFHFNGQYLMRHKVHQGLLSKTLRDFERENDLM